MLHAKSRVKPQGKQIHSLCGLVFGEAIPLGFARYFQLPVKSPLDFVLIKALPALFLSLTIESKKLYFTPRIDLEQPKSWGGHWCGWTQNLGNLWISVSRNVKEVFSFMWAGKRRRDHTCIEISDHLALSSKVYTYRKNFRSIRDNKTMGPKTKNQVILYKEGFVMKSIKMQLCFLMLFMCIAITMAFAKTLPA